MVNHCNKVLKVKAVWLYYVYVAALPPPPALEEEAPANYFNLNPISSPVVMNINLPPLPRLPNPPPPGAPFISTHPCIYTYNKTTKTEIKIELQLNRNVKKLLIKWQAHNKITKNEIKINVHLFGY